MERLYIHKPAHPSTYPRLNTCLDSGVSRYIGLWLPLGTSYVTSDCVIFNYAIIVIVYARVGFCCSFLVLVFLGAEADFYSVVWYTLYFFLSSTLISSFPFKLCTLPFSISFPFSCPLCLEKKIENDNHTMHDELMDLSLREQLAFLNNCFLSS